MCTCVYVCKHYTKLKFIYHVLSCHNSIRRIQIFLLFFLLKVRKKKSSKLAYHKVYFSAAWCKRYFTLWPNKRRQKHLFSCFSVELRWGGGVAQFTWWLNLPHSPLPICPSCNSTFEFADVLEWWVLIPKSKHFVPLTIHVDDRKVGCHNLLVYCSTCNSTGYLAVATTISLEVKGNLSTCV